MLCQFCLDGILPASVKPLNQHSAFADMIDTNKDMNNYMMQTCLTSCFVIHLLLMRAAVSVNLAKPTGDGPFRMRLN